MNSQNYQKLMEQRMEQLAPGTPLLLHVCCAPCASVALERLAGRFAPRVFFENPNLWPEEEYTLRKSEVARLLREMPLQNPAAWVESAYGPEGFSGAVSGLEAEAEGGARCAACFALRLEAAAQKTAELGLGLFTTSLTVGPNKNAALLNELGSRAAQKYGVEFLPCDFKKKEGYKRSLALSAEYGLYRQNYCGCRFSLRE